jgi:hypothetical protein
MAGSVERRDGCSVGLSLAGGHANLFDAREKRFEATS